MSTRRPPGLQKNYLRNLFLAILGTNELKTALAAITILIALGWLGTSLYELLVMLIAWVFLDKTFEIINIVTALLLSLLCGGAILWLLHKARRKGASLGFRIATDDAPKRARALILYLSNPNDVDSKLLDSVNGDISDASLRKRFAGSWRMPLEAIAYHKATLREIVLITSTDSATHTGSNRYAEVFEGLLNRLCNGATPRIRSAGDFVSEYADGVNFEDMEQLVSVTNAVFDALIDENMQRSDILIDVTSGTKVATAAGTVVALAEGRRFQYVSTQDYQVRTYDPTYDPE